MSDAKPMNIPLGGHFKLSKAHAPTTKDEKAHVGGVIYISCAMVCTRPDMAQAVRIFSRHMSNLKKEYWKAVK